MKKKFLAVTLSALMAASLAACSGGQAETTAAETTAAAAAAETAESAESSEAAETEAGAESAEAESAAAAVETVTEGKLTVATSPDFAPYEFYAIGEDGTPTLAGFDMALAQYIADYMGL